MVLPRSSQPLSRNLMAHTLRRSCPPHTRIVRRSGSTSSSPTAGSSVASSSPLASSSLTGSQVASFHSGKRYLWPTKDAQDKDSLKPTSTEYSKSGSDDAAAHDDAAFDPSQTKPETEAQNMGESENSTEGDPLSVSPGNPEVSKPRDPQEGGAENATGEGRARTSGYGGANKAGGGKSG